MAPKDIKHLFTEKGDVIKALVIYGAKTLNDIESIISQTAFERWTDLHILIGELIQEGDITLQDNGEYKVTPELEEDYTYYEEHMDEWLEPPEEWEYPDFYKEPEIQYPDIIKSVQSWLKMEKPEVSIKDEHFYLEGHHLDTFTKFIISQAFNTIIVVNPFIDRITPTQLLVGAKRNGKRVVIVTKKKQSQHSRQLVKWLEGEGIVVLHHENLHAKIIIVDESLAVVSSMNFLRNATSGLSWEAGMVTISKKVVDDIKASIADLNASP